MRDFTVTQRGTDTSGRPLFATEFMWATWDRVVEALGFEPTIVQGAFMSRAGGGATDSAGYHDGAGCLDLRTWDRSADEVEQMIRTLRRFGAAAWRRDQRHGMDPHIHFVLGADSPLDSGAAYQWRQYLAGRDGLASNGSDYEWRPDPLVTEPPEDDMAQYADQLDKIQALATETATGVDRLLAEAKATKDRDRRLAEGIRKAVKSGKTEILEAIADELDS